MSSSRQPFEPVENNAVRFLRTVAGLIVIFTLLAGGLVLFFVNSQEDDIELERQRFVPSLYLSALDGKLLQIEEEEQTSLEMGQSLVPGIQYQVNAGSLALLRSSAVEFEAMIAENSVFRVSGDENRIVLSIDQGTYQIDYTSKQDSSLQIIAGQTLLKALSGCIAEIKFIRNNLTLKLLSGKMAIDVGDQVTDVSAGKIAYIENGELSIEEKGVLESPYLISPAAGSVMRKASDQPLTVDLVWMEVEEATSYLVEVATDVMFRNRVASQTLTKTNMRIIDAGPGVYYWRVTAKRGGDVVSPASDSMPFVVQMMANPEDEIVSAPDLKIAGVTAQSNLISVKGTTEPGARIIVYLEAMGRLLNNPREIIVDPTGSFSTNLEAPERGELRVVIQAFYRPEFMTRKTATVFVDF